MLIKLTMSERQHGPGSEYFYTGFFTHLRCDIEQSNGRGLLSLLDPQSDFCEQKVGFNCKRAGPLNVFELVALHERNGLMN